MLPSPPSTSPCLEPLVKSTNLVNTNRSYAPSFIPPTLRSLTLAWFGTGRCSLLKWAINPIFPRANKKKVENSLNFSLRQAVAFIHCHHIDILHENFLVNFWGTVPPARADGEKPPELQSLFSVKYAIVALSNLHRTRILQAARVVGVFQESKSAPEVLNAKFDPFAADVYQAGRTIYGWCQVLYTMV